MSLTSPPLEADQLYRVADSSRNEQVLCADTQGKARLSVYLDGRTALRIERVQTAFDRETKLAT